MLGPVGEGVSGNFSGWYRDIGADAGEPGLLLYGILGQGAFGCMDADGEAFEARHYYGGDDLDFGPDAMSLLEMDRGGLEKEEAILLSP